AYVNAADGSMDVVLSDQAGACDSAKASKLHAGETLVQMYALKGTPGGPYTSETNDIKYATVRTTCTSGAPVETSVARAAAVTTPPITIKTVTSWSVEGTADITFDDGSAANGTFIVPTCTATLKNPVCT